MGHATSLTKHLPLLRSAVQAYRDNCSSEFHLFAVLLYRSSLSFINASPDYFQLNLVHIYTNQAPARTAGEYKGHYRANMVFYLIIPHQMLKLHRYEYLLSTLQITK